MRDITVKQLDRAQKGPRPSDFGDHEPIDEEAVISLPLGPDSLIVSDSSICEKKE